MSSFKRQTCDGLQRVECDFLRLKRTKINTPTSSSVTLTLPATDGTLATLDDITGISGSFVNVSATQTVTGAKTFSNILTTSNNVLCTGVSSHVRIDGNQASSGPGSGALRVTGGAYIGGPSFYDSDVVVTGTISVSGSTSFISISNTSTAVSAATGALRVAGGAYFGGGCLFNSYLTSVDTFGLYASNVVNCSFGSFPSGGGGKVLFNTESSSTFNGTLSLPSLASSVTYTLPSATSTLVGRDITETLTNKTLNVVKVGTNGSTHNHIQFGRISNSGGGSSIFSVTFPAAFSTTPTVSIVAERNNTDFVFLAQLVSVNTTGFSYRYVFFTIANPCGSFPTTDGHTLHWVART